MSARPSSDGKLFLEGLILQAETILGKMIFKLHRTDVQLAEMVPMINSVYDFVNLWDGPLKEITLEMLHQPRAVKSNEDAIMEQVSQLDRPDDPLEVVGEGRKARSKRLVRIREDSEPVFEFPEQSLKDYAEGQTGTCFISHALPGSTTFYMLDRTKSAGKSEEALRTLQNVTTTLGELPESSNIVFGVNLDGQIFRAIRSEAASSVPFLRLLDTGEILSYSETMVLYELPLYYQHLPPFAVRCELLDVVDKPFCADFPRYLEQNLYAIKKYEVCIREESYLKVNLSNVPKTKLNGQVQVQRVEAVPQYKVSEKTLTQEQLTILYEEPLNTTNVMKATMGYVPKDDQRICPFYDPKIQGCFKGSSCRLEHVAKDIDGWTRDKAPHKVKIRAQLIEPQRGDVVQMVPTVIVSVEEFYAHLCSKEHTQGLIELQQRLNEPSTIRGFRKMDHEPYVNEYVFARFKEDGLWYRAEVLEFNDIGELAHVFYLDYGNHGLANMDELRLWDDGFDYLPFQAIHCRLANVSRAKQDDEEPALVLHNAIWEKKVAVKVLDIRSQWEVLVYVGVGIDIGQYLVERNLAHPREPIILTDPEGFVPV